MDIISWTQLSAKAVTCFGPMASVVVGYEGEAYSCQGDAANECIILKKETERARGQEPQEKFSRGRKTLNDWRNCFQLISLK